MSCTFMVVFGIGFKELFCTSMVAKLGKWLKASRCVSGRDFARHCHADAEMTRNRRCRRFNIDGQLGRLKIKF
jgi:hypothetical protein